ncbi:MAG: FHA domain-containing protein [Halobacteriovoraceae bacterium]|nr:FHA domain-containing protein [Halobacteriovoraceae bacterium]
MILRIVQLKNPKSFDSDIEFQQYTTLKPGESVTIGRSRKSDVRIPDDYSSSIHLQVRYTGTQVLVSDTISKNGTKLNGVTISHETPIYIKDLVTIGKTFIHIDEDKTPEEAVQKLTPRNDDKTISLPHDKTGITSTRIEKFRDDEDDEENDD